MFSHKKILGNAFAQFLGKFITIFTSFFIVKMITGIGTEFYGKYITAYEFLAFFGILADMGLFAVAVREISKVDNQKQSALSPPFILGNILSARLLLVLLTIFLAGFCAQFVSEYDAELKLGIWITAISMGLTMIAGTLSSVLQARMKIPRFSLSIVIGKIILALLVFLIIQNVDFFAGFSLFFALLWAGVFSNLVFTVLVYYFASQEIKISLQWDWEFIKKTLKSTFSYGLALVLQTLYLRLDILLVSMILGIATAGIYGVATRVLESVLVLGVFFGQAILPQISASEKNPAKISQILGWGMEKLLIFSLPIIIGTFFFASEIVQFLSSTEFLSTTTEIRSDTVLKVLIPTVFFAFFNQLFTFTLVAKNLQKKLVLINGLALIANGVLNIVFLAKYGIIAAAISTIFCEILVFGLLLKQILRYFKPQFSGKNLLIIFAANFLVFAEIYFTPLGQNLLWAIPVCGISYLAVLATNYREFLNK